MSARETSYVPPAIQGWPFARSEGSVVDGAGLKELAGLEQLRSLDLRYSQLTDAGVKELKEALPKCEIHR